jgi:hypothetical protein
MTVYRYVFPLPVYYPDMPLMARPGDEREFDTPPDFRWVPVETDEPEVKAPAKAKRASAGE